MKPVTIKITNIIPMDPPEICKEIINTERWSEFKGYSILPGIKSAHFEVKPPGLIGSRIVVQNNDGSSHVEEIIEWDTMNRVSLRFQEFDSPLQNLATHFVETWEFRNVPEGTETSRMMVMHPKGVWGWLLLLPISRLMKRAFEENVRQINNSPGFSKT